MIPPPNKKKKKMGKSRNISNVQWKISFEPQPTYQFPVDGQRELIVAKITLRKFHQARRKK